MKKLITHFTQKKICLSYMTSIVTGNYPLVPTAKVLTATSTLYAGTHCNDGRPITESYRYKKAKLMGVPIVLLEEQQKEKKELFVDKYKPKTIQDIIGHKEQLNELGKWLDAFPISLKNPDYKRGVLITGPPGIGKTTMAHLVATTLGYKVAEYNASDTRSIKSLEGLGQARLFKEVVIMDEIDGLSERGSIGEIAALIKTSRVPIICIANEKPPKLKPIISVTLDIKCSRPMKSTVAIALAKKISGTTKEQIEKLCEQSGNDIRAVLNTLDFGQSAEGLKTAGGLKDPQHDIFSATFKLFRNKKLPFAEADDLVFTDFNMVPLMVQEAYAAASSSIEELEAAADRLSLGDMMTKQLYRDMNDWTLLPHIVSNAAAVTKMVTGPAPNQIFPQFLGKESKRTKHRTWSKDMAYRMDIPVKKMRLDYMGAIHTLVLNWLLKKDGAKEAAKNMTELGLIREDLDTIQDLSMEKMEIPTKNKTAVTREFTKLLGKKRKSEQMEEDEEEDEVDMIENELDVLEL
jgi:replication factor C subunit 1